MLTQTSDPTGVLLGCGVDAEAIDRFETIPASERAWHLVFTEAELAHCHALPRPALGLCVAFCCKESLCKGIGVVNQVRGDQHQHNDHRH